MSSIKINPLRRLAILWICLIVSLSANAQKRANHWSLYNYGLNFNTVPVTVTSQFASHQNTSMGVISDESGQLLFYTNGQTVWNRNHSPMGNGLSLAGSNQTEFSSIVIPKPGNNNLYYIFTLVSSDGWSSSGLYYSEVDMTLDGGLGDVTVKGNLLVSNTTQVMSAVFHQNQSDVWLVAEEANTDKFFVLLITSTGISSEILEQNIGASHSLYSGQIKFSPDGRKLAHCNYYTGISLLDFDNVTGVISNHMALDANVYDYYSSWTEGVEFSSDATKLYTVDRQSNHLLQFDVTLPDADQINASRYIFPTTTSYNGFYKFQLAPDGRIYITKGGGGGGTSHLGFIKNPNAKGSQLIVEENGLFLEGGESAGNYTPNFIQNYFFKTSFNYENNCQSTPIKFSITNEYLIDSVLWNFGEGSTSKLRSPEIQYENAGTYTVKLIAYYENRTDTITQEIVINPYTSFDLGENQAFCSGTKLSALDGLESYLWNTGDSSKSIVLKETEWYKLTAINNFGCSYTDSVFVTIKALPNIEIPDSVHFDGSASVVLDAGEFSSYEWSNGSTSRSVTIQEPGWYSVVVTNAEGCINSKSVFVGDHVTVPPSDGWVWMNPLPTGKSLQDIYFVDDNTGFIVNGENIFRTLDGGLNWQQQATMSAKHIAFNDHIGYAVGDHGSVYKSTYNGGGWNQVKFDYSDNLNAVSVIHPDTVIISSNNNLYVSHDGGLTWVERNIPDVTVNDSYFTSSSIGHVACRNGIILKTSDGGISWKETENAQVFPSDFFTIEFITSEVGYATRQHYDLLKTVDGGETWTEFNNNYDAIYDIFFINENVGYVATEYGSIKKTVDGGLSWSWVGFQNGYYDNSNINALFFHDEENGFAVGSGGRILKTKNGGSNWSAYAFTYKDINDVTFPTPSTGYAIGEKIYKTVDGGISWVALSGPSNNGYSFQKAYFLSADKGFIFSNSYYYYSTAYRTNDGGSTWTQLDINVTSLSFIDNQTGFALSDGLYKTIDGGQTWQYVSYFYANDLHFIDQNNGFAIQSGNLYKTVNGGLNWTLVNDEYGYFNEIKFASNKVGYICSDNGFVLKTTDGGNTWTKKETEYDHLIAIDFINENIGVASGEYGNCFLTYDGGNTWNNIPAGLKLTSIDIIGNKVFGGGNSGALLYKTLTYPEIVIKALSADSITANRAVLKGVVASNGNNIEDIHIEFGLNNSFSNSIPLTPASVATGEGNEYSFTANNLIPDSLYSFRFSGMVNGIIQYSNIVEFTTLPEVQFNFMSAYAISAISANVYCEVKSNMNQITNLVYEYDTAFSFQTKKEQVSMPSSIAGGEYTYTNATLENLLPNTPYYVRLKGLHDGKEFTSKTVSFTTLPEYEINLFSPFFNGNEVQFHASVSSHNLPLTNIKFEYGLSQNNLTSVNSTPSEIDGMGWDYVMSTARVDHLDSIYYYRMRATYNGNEITTDFGFFRASGGIILITNDAHDITTNSASLNGVIALQNAYIYDVIFEYGPTRSFGYVEPVTVDSYFADTYYISANLDSLNDGKEYYFRLVALYWDGSRIYSETKKFSTELITNIQTEEEFDNVTLYPNPASDELNVISSRVMERMEVVDGLGRQMMNVHSSGFNYYLPVANLPSGTYYVKVYQEGLTIIRKFIIRH